VEDIFIPVEYKRIFQHSLGNIAIMVSKKVFKFTLTVQPVCVDWTKSSDDILNSKEKEFGYVGFMLLILKSIIFYKSALL
jgi:hypothetical protein